MPLAIIPWLSGNLWRTGTLALLLALGGLYLHDRHTARDRDRWRDAAHGWQAAYTTQSNVVQAVEARARANKIAVEARNEERRRKSNEALRQDAINDRRDADAYKRTHRVPVAGPPAAGDLSGPGDHLPSPGYGTGKPDSAGAGAIMVSELDFDICTENTRRLLNAHDWALEAAIPVN